MRDRNQSMPHGIVEPVLEERTPIIGEPRPRESLTIPEKARMFDLLDDYFVGADRASFEADLAEKESVVLLREETSGRIQGFSTVMILRTTIDDREVVAFYSGDTIVDRRFWGSFGMHTAWARHVWSLASEIDCSEVYWFYVSSGYRTYRFLPVFFNEFYPSHRQPTPAAIVARINRFAEMRFGSAFDLESGIVTFPKLVPLRDGIGEVTEREMRDPHISFFVNANPEHHLGKSLACIASLSYANLSRAGRRVVGVY